MVWAPTQKEQFYKRDWFRGGFIGLFMPLIFYGYFVFFGDFFAFSGGLWGVLGEIFIFLFIIPTVYLGELFKLPILRDSGGSFEPVFNTFGWIFTEIVWFLIGSFCGWLIGKIKNLKKTQLL